MNESEVIRIINKVCGRLSSKFTFGYHEREDIAQQAFIFGIEGLSSYDDTRPLENFLWVHIKNRLCTFKRDNYERPNKPCLRCKSNNYDKSSDNNIHDVCKEYDDIMECKLYNGWRSRNTSKKNILKTVELDNVQGDRENHLKNTGGVDDLVCEKEMTTIIDRHLPNILRPDYLKMISGILVPSHKRLKVQAAILEIMGANGYINGDFDDFINIPDTPEVVEEEELEQSLNQ